MKRPRLVLALVMAAFALVGYLGLREFNPVTGEHQHVALSQDQEVALGLESAPQMAAEFGGLDADPTVQADVAAVGERIVRTGVAASSPYRFQFQVLRDAETVNAFALPGGPIFITRGLLDRLENEAQLAGILGHEIGHVLGRHSAERIAKSQLGQALVGAVGVAASDDYDTSRRAAAMAAFVEQMVQLRYGRSDELQSDTLGVRLMAEAGYDPRALLGVMRVLREAGGGGGAPEFMSSHPDPGNREELIERAIARRFPGGVPAHLTLGRPIVVEPGGAVAGPRGP